MPTSKFLERGDGLRFVCDAGILNDRLQLSRIAQRVLDDAAAHAHDVLARTSERRLVSARPFGWRREPDATVSRGPALGGGEVEDRALGLEEEKVFGGGDGEGGVGAGEAGCDFGSDRVYQDLGGGCWSDERRW